MGGFRKGGFTIVGQPRFLTRKSVIAREFLLELDISLAIWVDDSAIARATPCGGVKQGRFVILRFPLFCSVWGSQDTHMLGKTARKVSLSPPFSCAPYASKN